jgi:group I intron endonuclease
LQAAWNKYGEHGLVFEVLQYCEPDMCEALEQAAITIYNPAYNLSADTSSPFKGRRHTDSAKEKISMRNSGKKKPPFTDEHRKKLSISGKGKKRSPRSPEWCEKLRIANTGKVLSAEHRAAISISGKGTTRPPVTDAHRKAISASKMGKCLGASNHAARSVMCVETFEIFQTINDAAAWVQRTKRPSATAPNISSCCTGKLKSAYGYHWQYA